MSVETALAVLATRTLRWSSPLLFNDPFDVPRELSFGLTPAEIVSALKEQLADLIQDPPEDTASLHPGVRLILETVKSGISPEVRTELLEGLKAMHHAPSSANLDTLREMWRAWVPTFRILCLSESPNHIAMWYHYANAYRGVALEFRCVDSLDSAWLAARPVAYSTTKPEIYTARGWAKTLMLQVEHGVRRLFDIAAYSKATDWSYEHEWRITTFKRETDVGLFTDYPFNPQELATIYLGPLIDGSDRRVIESLAHRYPSVSVKASQIGFDAELHFSSVER
jgi:Protein of unknown function (DUF2971)